MAFNVVHSISTQVHHMKLGDKGILKTEFSVALEHRSMCALGQLVKPEPLGSVDVPNLKGKFFTSLT